MRKYSIPGLRSLYYKYSSTRTVVNKPLINYLDSDYALQCSSSNSSAELDDIGFSPSKSFWSVGLLLAGIIMARFGLWVSDLTINQQLQENVQEEHRKYFIIFDHSVQIISKVIHTRYSKH